MNSTLELDPTCYGFIESTYDALLLFEACIAGQIKHVSRRPHELERDRVIQSGSIFIYEENSSGIKRWTDGVSWSPSRILGNFLVYRQLAKSMGSGEKKRAIKNPKVGFNGDNLVNYRNKENKFQMMNNLSTMGGSHGRVGMITFETQRTLIGSLTDSYDFLEDGLVKKTISISHGGAAYHLVSYYTMSDAINQQFIVPSKDSKFAGIHPRLSLLSSQNFRSAIDGIDSADRMKYLQHKNETTKQIFFPYLIPTMPAFDIYSGYIGTINRFSNTDSVVSIPSAPVERGLPTYASTIAYRDDHLANFGTYSAQKPLEIYPDGHKHHLTMEPSYNPNSSRATMLMATDWHVDVPSFRQRVLVDTGFSMPMEKTIDASSLCNKPNSFGVFPQDAILMANSIAVHKISPSSSDGDFSVQLTLGKSIPYEQKHLTTGSLDCTDIWPLGNASVGHGHYQNL